MSIPDVSQAKVAKQIADIEYTGRKHGPRMAAFISIIAFVWSLFQLWIASPFPYLANFGIIFGVEARSIHLAFGLVLCFLMFPATKGLTERRLGFVDIALVGGACYAALYIYIAHAGLVERRGIPLTIDLMGMNLPFETMLGGIGILLLLEATRRAIGLPLVIVAAVFLLYSIFGQSMPEIISHRGVSLNRLIGYQWLGGEAIFGIPIDVSVSFVFLFVLFGALLEKAGAGRYFLDLAFAMVGRFRGGPAKAAILASGMTGAISGSSIANVVTTGTFTIPVMVKTGYPAIKAGAIEVAASTNGQIMPPIMGAAAFVMAEFLGISYFDVITAAFIPAVVSYIALFYISHLEAMKLGLKGLPKNTIPPLGPTFRSGLHFLIPIAILIYLLIVERWSAGSAVFYSIILLMAYSTMPRAPASLRPGTILRTIESSTIVLTSTQSGSDNVETVGFCNAGSSSSTLSRSMRATFIIKPTLPSAARLMARVRSLCTTRNKAPRTIRRVRTTKARNRWARETNGPRGSVLGSSRAAMAPISSMGGQRHGSAAESRALSTIHQRNMIRSWIDGGIWTFWVGGQGGHSRGKKQRSGNFLNRS